MVLTSSVSFLLVGLLFLFVGYGIRKQLSQLPYNYPGAAELQRRVMRVSLVVGPTCIVRAVIILFQLSAWFGDDDGFIDFIQGRGESGRYFPLMFYVVFEICPILIIFMTVQLNSANEKDEDDEAPPQQVRNQSIAAYSHETRSIETMFSSNRPTQATRAKGSSISPLGLNVSQRQVVMTGDPQQAKAAVVPLKDALKISSATPPAKSSKPLPAAAADLDGFPGFLPPPDSASPPTVDDSACDSNRPETLGPFSSSLNADEADHHPSRD
ncbi:hypothetical protein DIPPA_11801 [Diplonema papillatum]|nr:hypothetical protein DIPPA_11801 [Diplonema papillatum]